MPTSARPSNPDLSRLDAWLANQRTTRCHTCNLPAEVLAEVNAALRRKTPVRGLAGYLADEHDIHLPWTTLDNHRNAKHHER